jgi:hypothetical protein
MEFPACPREMHMLQYNMCSYTPHPSSEQMVGESPPNAPQEQEHLIAPLLKSKWAISWTPGSVKLDVQKPLMLLLWGEIEISL